MTADAERAQAPTTGPRRSLDALAALSVLAVVLLADQWSRLYHRNIVDDALISLRYAQQWVAGNGLVFNTGERVEGYTNFLWTVFLGLGVWLSEGLSLDPVRVASVSSILFAAVDVALVYAVGRRIWGARALPTVVALGAVVLDNAYTVWAFQALESHFVSFWMLTALLVWQGRGRLWGVRLGLVLGALWMTRPDAGLFVVCLLGSEALEQLLRWRRERGVARTLHADFAAAPDRRADFAALGHASLVCLAVFGGYFAWRYSYYGFLLPNTFYAKVGGEGFDAWLRGGSYLASFLADRAWVPCLALLAFVGLREPVVRALAAWGSAYVVYIVSVGGDFYPGHRFFVILIPVVALLMGYGFHRIERAVATAETGAGLGAPRLLLWGGALALLLSVLAFGLVYGPVETEIRRYADFVQRNRVFMTWLGENSPADATVLSGDIGSVGVFADRPVLDFYGMVDANVAHQQLDSLGQGKPGHEKTASLEYILEQRPEYLKFGLLFLNHYDHGYYLDVSMPIEFGVTGIWRLDRLPETSRPVGASLLTGAAIDPAGWSTEGEAFADFPTERTVHQIPGGEPHFPLGQSGAYASSWAEGAGASATGSLVSPPFLLVGEQLSLRVAGGYDPERLRVCLLVGERNVRCATGFESLAFGRQLWDITPYRGESARLVIVDRSTERSGVILVDEVQQWASLATAGAAASPLPPGRWMRLAPPASEDADDPALLARLQALGYAAGSESPRSDALVARYDPERAAAGINFLVSGHRPSAELRDMQGRVLQRWAIDFHEVWPDREIAPDNHFWRRAHVFENGDLLALFDGLGILKLDKGSNLLWANEIGAHHDLQVLPDGDIAVLTRVARVDARFGSERPLLEDFVTLLGPDGREKRSHSLLALLERSEHAASLAESRRTRSDPTHANSIEVFSGRFADRAPWLAAGNVLTSFRELHLIAVVDLEAGEIVKSWTGDFRFQHDPKLLDDARLLFFDNQGREGLSRVIEIEPVTGDVVWVHPRNPDDDFYSEFCGAAQRLDNGNTLVTESSRGRAFEVTPDGDVVWELFSPHRAGDRDQYVASLLELVRLPEDFGAEWRSEPR